MRAFLPQDLQRFSIDLDFYSTGKDIHDILEKVREIPGVKYAGYGIESEGRFKRYDSLVPADVEKCTIALTKHYRQSFSVAGMDPEFYVTVSNTLTRVRYELRKPRSYIGIEYVKESIPILSPELIISSKIRAIGTRKVKDFYKDVFDIYALLKLSDALVDEAAIVSALSTPRLRIRRANVYSKFKESSDEDNARNAIKLPTESRKKYLMKWKHMNSLVREMTLSVLEKAGAFIS